MGNTLVRIYAVIMFIMIGVMFFLIRFDSRKDKDIEATDVKGIYKVNSDLEDKIDYAIVLDVTDEKSMDIAKIAGESLEASGVETFIINDVNLSAEDKLTFAYNNNVDLYIKISISEDDVTTAVYNDSYFIPDVNSVTLSDNLEQNVLNALDTKVGGLKRCDANDIELKEAKIPAASIVIGKMDTDEYEKKAASGIANAVINVKKIKE